MQHIKRFIDNHSRLIVGVIAIVVVGCLYWALKPDDAGALVSDVNDQTWIDVDGNVFTHHLVAFDEKPVVGPTGKPAFRAELCYWTKDGKTKKTGTPVLLNSNVGKSGPTFCPDCGRLVTALNAPPIDGVPDAEQHVPPTQAEYEKKTATRP